MTLGQEEFGAALLTFTLILAGASLPSTAVSQRANGCANRATGPIDTGALFHDGGPLYLQPTAPQPHARVTQTLRTAACNLTAAALSYRLSLNGATFSAPMRRLGRDRTGHYDLWQVTVTAGAAGSALYYRFDLHAGGAEQWYGANGDSPTPAGAGRFMIAPGFQTPGWAQDAVYYQIFPDRFKDGNPRNDVRSGEYSYQGNPVLAQPWTALPENPGKARDFFGGDLAGITEEIDPYLKQTIGVTAIYLNPIFQSLSNHKYDTQDYFKVDPHFGTNADLATLLRSAHGAAAYYYNVT
jgi:alpha-glucosidase